MIWKDAVAMKNAYIGLGSNLGNRVGNLAKALALLGSHPGIRLKRISPLYRSTPVGTAGPQPEYVNAVAKIQTSLAPHALLRCLNGIEQRLGRIRRGKNFPRVVDLDILTMGKTRVEEADLMIPHPRMLERRFVLEPLSDLRRGVIRPRFPKSVRKQAVTRLSGVGLRLPAR